MKKLFTVLTIGFLVFGLSAASSAQTKIGYISVEDLIGAMPEAKSADSVLQEYQYSLQMQGNDFIQELNEKDSAFTADSIKFNATTKELKRKDLLALYQKVSTWDKTMQQMIGEKQQVLVAPIRTKAYDAIKAVSTENKYTYILDANTLIVMPPADDILPLVKTKLKIKDQPAPKQPQRAAPGQ